MENIRIAILGPQGSGKGTQAELISKKYGLLHIDMGSSLRERQKKDDEIGRMMREIISRGELLPNDIPFSILKERLSENNKSFIIDGFPRNTDQLGMALEVTSFDMAIYVRISDEESVRRLGKRRICSSCKKIYIWHDGMRMECECGGKIVQRDDDRPDAIMKRLMVYHEQTELLLREYIDMNILSEINGEQGIEEVFNDICVAIENNIMMRGTRQE